MRISDWSSDVCSSDLVAKRRALDRDQRVDRYAFGMARQRRQRVDEADAMRARLAHADDPARADVDPRLADVAERIDPLLEGPRGDDVGVILGRGIDIVVVILEPRRLALCRGRKSVG